MVKLNSDQQYPRNKVSIVWAEKKKLRTFKNLALTPCQRKIIELPKKTISEPTYKELNS